MYLWCIFRIYTVSTYKEQLSYTYVDLYGAFYNFSINGPFISFHHISTYLHSAQHDSKRLNKDLVSREINWVYLFLYLLYLHYLSASICCFNQLLYFLFSREMVRIYKYVIRSKHSNYVFKRIRIVHRSGLLFMEIFNLIYSA